MKIVIVHYPEPKSQNKWSKVLHELPLTNKILDIALDYALKNKASGIVSVQIGLGVMHEAEPEWMNKYFSWISRGTAAENAILEFIKYPIVWLCQKCRKPFSDSGETTARTVCPECAENRELILISGKEFRVESIIVS